MERADEGVTLSDITYGTAVFVISVLIGCGLLAAIMLPLWVAIRLSEWLGPGLAEAVIVGVGWWVVCIWFVSES